ncbi:MAG: hypothetical protein RL088_1076 [Verrucomicrobiota bacterium]
MRSKSDRTNHGGEVENRRPNVANPADAELLATIGESSVAGAYRTDVNGLCTWVNGKWCELSGLSFEQALGTGWQRAIHPDDFERLMAEWNGLPATRRVFLQRVSIPPSGWDSAMDSRAGHRGVRRERRAYRFYWSVRGYYGTAPRRQSHKDAASRTQERTEFARARSGAVACEGALEQANR